ncbi:MAG TPA: thiamine-phosphate kinase [Methylovirgula sp.]|nr:thiamine-phosphate kinase [Methylovirgula sp.]
MAAPVTLRPTEDEIIENFFAPLAGPAGLGLRDDAALLSVADDSELVMTTDVLTSGVHFFASDPPDAIARKALRVNLSDLAAKAAEPIGFLLGLALPGDWTAEWLDGFAKGLADDAACFACPLIGGDTVKSLGGLTLTITALGTVPKGKFIPRRGVEEGDVLYVTGTIGDAALGLRLRRGNGAERPWGQALSSPARDYLLMRYLLPLPRLGLRDGLRAHARAAMDVSDGLLGDLTQMLRLSGMTAELALTEIPLSKAARQALAQDPTLVEPMLTGGDDYEILCAVAPENEAGFKQEAAAGGLTVTPLARARRGEEKPLVKDAEGLPLAFSAASFRHF